MKPLYLGLFALRTISNRAEQLAADYQDLAASRFGVCVIDQQDRLKCNDTRQMSRYAAPSDDFRYTDVTLGVCWDHNSNGQTDVPTTGG